MLVGRRSQSDVTCLFLRTLQPVPRMSREAGMIAMFEKQVKLVCRETSVPFLFLACTLPLSLGLSLRMGWL